MERMARIDEIKTKVENGKHKQLPGLVQAALDEGVSAKKILNTMISAMGVVGEKFSCGRIFVPEMLMAGRAMSVGLDVLKPVLAGNNAGGLGTCIIGTVQGDLHDIGKSLVCMMIERVGFTIVDLGVDVAPEQFVEAVKNSKDVKLVACSGLLSTTMPALKKTVGRLKSCGIKGFKVIVGGIPVTPEYASEIGADGYASDAGRAAIKAQKLVTA